MPGCSFKLWVPLRPQGRARPPRGTNRKEEMLAARQGQCQAPQGRGGAQARSISLLSSPKGATPHTPAPPHPLPPSAGCPISCLTGPGPTRSPKTDAGEALLPPQRTTVIIGAAEPHSTGGPGGDGPSPSSRLRAPPQPSAASNATCSGLKQSREEALDLGCMEVGTLHPESCHPGKWLEGAEHRRAGGSEGTWRGHAQGKGVGVQWVVSGA